MDKRHFAKEGSQVATRPVKQCHTSLVIRRLWVVTLPMWAALTGAQLWGPKHVSLMMPNTPCRAHMLSASVCSWEMSVYVFFHDFIGLSCYCWVLRVLCMFWCFLFNNFYCWNIYHVRFLCICENKQIWSEHIWCQRWLKSIIIYLFLMKSFSIQKGIENKIYSLTERFISLTFAIFTSFHVF